MASSAWSACGPRGADPRCAHDPGLRTVLVAVVLVSVDAFGIEVRQDRAYG